MFLSRMYQLGLTNQIAECGPGTPPFIVTMETTIVLNIMVMFTSVLLK